MLASRGATPATRPAQQQPGEQPGLELASVHSLMRVCGVAAEPQAALRLLSALRKDKIYPDSSCYSAYLNGRQSRLDQLAAVGDAPPKRALGVGKELLRSGYERLLQLECCPERVGGAPGGIEKIRIQW